VEYGAHLPLIALDGPSPTLAGITEYARAAAALEFDVLCANDHLLFGRPWLDGPTALAAALEAAAGMAIATTVALPVVRGPAQTAKLLAALDLLSGGRLIAGVGPGSSARDYALAGVQFDERWKRFDEAIRALRSLLSESAPDFTGTFYSTAGVVLEPRPASPAGPPIWVAGWGSAAGLRRVARLGDGWLASAYNTTPEAFGRNVATLAELRGAELPNAIATTWLYVTDSRRDAARMFDAVLAPMLGRPPEALRELALPIGPAELCAERIAAFAQAGAQRVFLWPLADELRQLERFRDRVAPLVEG
jgi:alkanesulfonate monooxygenase SsuD/methylene tetrahydromethanopterin reductase-like flavin-dependent oxidoreductase (luciferase family)